LRRERPIRQTIDLDESKMREAASGARAKCEAVEMEARTLLLLHQQEGIRAWRGKLPWEGDLEAMRTEM
jgi:hypothetical protein